MEESNPFEEAEGDPETEAMASYGFSITNYDMEKRVIDDYRGGDLTVDFKFNNTGSETEVGIMAFFCFQKSSVPSACPGFFLFSGRLYQRDL